MDTSPMQPQKIAGTHPQFSKGELVHIWSNSQNSWMTDGRILEVLAAPAISEGPSPPAGVVMPVGAVKIASRAGTKWIMPDFISSQLRKVSQAPLAIGEAVHIWSNSKNAWMTDGKVLEVLAAPVVSDGGSMPAGSVLPIGSVKVASGAGTKWILPDLVGIHLRKATEESVSPLTIRAPLQSSLAQPAVQPTVSNQPAAVALPPAHVQRSKTLSSAPAAPQQQEPVAMGTIVAPVRPTAPVAPIVATHQESSTMCTIAAPMKPSVALANPQKEPASAGPSAAAQGSIMSPQPQKHAAPSIHVRGSGKSTPTASSSAKADSGVRAAAASSMAYAAQAGAPVAPAIPSLPVAPSVSGRDARMPSMPSSASFRGAAWQSSNSNVPEMSARLARANDLQQRLLQERAAVQSNVNAGPSVSDASPGGCSTPPAPLRSAPSFPAVEAPAPLRSAPSFPAEKPVQTPAQVRMTPSLPTHAAASHGPPPTAPAHLLSGSSGGCDGPAPLRMAPSFPMVQCSDGSYAAADHLPSLKELSEHTMNAPTTQHVLRVLTKENKWEELSFHGHENFETLASAFLERHGLRSAFRGGLTEAT